MSESSIDPVQLDEPVVLLDRDPVPLIYVPVRELSDDRVLFRSLLDKGTKPKSIQPTSDPHSIQGGGSAAAQAGGKARKQMIVLDHEAPQGSLRYTAPLGDRHIQLFTIAITQEEPLLPFIELLEPQFVELVRTIAPDQQLIGFNGRLDQILFATAIGYAPDVVCGEPFNTLVLSDHTAMVKTFNLLVGQMLLREISSMLTVFGITQTVSTIKAASS